MEAKERVACFATAMIFALVLCGTANADRGEKVDTSLNDGGLVTSTSWKSNYLIYRSIGGKTEVKGKEMKRKWCAWLVFAAASMETEPLLCHSYHLM